MFAEAVQRAGIPDGVVNIVTGTGPRPVRRWSGTATSRWCRSPGPPARAAGSRRSPPATVKRVHLELGGKAPFVVFDDADLEAAAQGAVAGALINAGQDCTAATRAYVQRPLYQEFVDRVADADDRSRPRTDRRPGDGPGLVDLGRPPRQGGRDGRPCARRGRQGRHRWPIPAPVRWSAAPTTSRRWSWTPRRTRRSSRTRCSARCWSALPVRRRHRRAPAGERHAVRSGGVGVDARRLPRAAGDRRDPGGLCLGQRPHPDHQRDAARRIQGSRGSART